MNLNCSKVFVNSLKKRLRISASYLLFGGLAHVLVLLLNFLFSSFLSLFFLATIDFNFIFC